MMKLQVGIVMGSENDLPVMEETAKVLKDYGIDSEVRFLSAHRTPDLAADYAKSAPGRGIKIIVAGAGMANHLAGAMAAHTTLPIIGVPLDASSLHGVDALYATVQMPPGIPVACVAIGKAGAKNAGHLAAQILALSDEAVAKKIVSLRQKTRDEMIRKNEQLGEKK